MLLPKVIIKGSFKYAENIKIFFNKYCKNPYSFNVETNFYYIENKIVKCININNKEYLLKLQNNGYHIKTINDVNILTNKKKII